MPSLFPNCVEQECGSRFEITDGEQKFFKEKGAVLPKRCKPCREKRRNRAVSPFADIAADLKKDEDFRYGKNRRQ